MAVAAIGTDVMNDLGRGGGRHSMQSIWFMTECEPNKERNFNMPSQGNCQVSSHTYYG